MNKKSFFLFVFLFFVSIKVDAATITVETTSDVLLRDGKCSLREAIVNANQNSSVYKDCSAGSSTDLDEVVLSDGIYYIEIEGSDEEESGDGDLDIYDSVVISGNGTDSTFVDGTYSTERAFYIYGNVEVQFENLTIQNFTVDNQTGGAIYAQKGATVSLDHCEIGYNTAEIAGALYAASAEIAINETEIYHNTSTDTSAPKAIYTIASNVTITSSDLYYNGTALSGSFKEAFSYMGIVAGFYSDSNLAMNETSFTNNHGGLFAADSSMTIDESIISTNAAPYVGGLGLNRVNLKLSNSEVSGNASIIFSGSGIMDLGGSTISIFNTTISGNKSVKTEDLGGAVGGILIGENSSAKISNSTITNNQSDGVAGGVYVSSSGSGATLTLKSTILSGNVSATSHNNCYNDGTSTVESSGYNFFETGTSTDCIITIDSTSDFEGGHSLLELKSLDDNGGFSETHRIGQNSKAVDAGSCDSIVDFDEDGSEDDVTLDQRSSPRDKKCDIGSFELKNKISFEKLPETIIFRIP